MEQCRGMSFGKSSPCVETSQCQPILGPEQFGDISASRNVWFPPKDPQFKMLKLSSFTIDIDRVCKGGSRELFWSSLTTKLITNIIIMWTYRALSPMWRGRARSSQLSSSCHTSAPPPPHTPHNISTLHTRSKNHTISNRYHPGTMQYLHNTHHTISISIHTLHNIHTPLTILTT